MVFDNRHSRLVALAKIALPLAALALLSTMFLFSDKVDPTAATPYANVDVTELANEPRLTTPEYSGLTEDGASITVKAKTAFPDAKGGSGANAQAIVAKLEAKSGLVADLTAKAGVIDPQAGQIHLSEGVALQTSSGYRMSTAAVDMATDRSNLVAPGAVSAEAPYGTITSGAMQMTRATPETPYDLVFNGGVKLVYQPQ